MSFGVVVVTARALRYRLALALEGLRRAGNAASRALSPGCKGKRALPTVMGIACGELSA